MKVTPLALTDVLLIEPKIFGDRRGFFTESFNQRAFNMATGTNFQFVQDNHSRSVRGVLRGLHYQISPQAQGKLVRVVRGAVWDVVVDIRKNSATYGQWLAQELTEDNGLQIWIPAGFAHGFAVLSDVVDYVYKTTAYYDPQWERGIIWNDADIGIQWPKGPWQLSEKDQKLPSLEKSLIEGA